MTTEKPLSTTKPCSNDIEKGPSGSDSEKCSPVAAVCSGTTLCWAMLWGLVMMISFLAAEPGSRQAIVGWISLAFMLGSMVMGVTITYTTKLNPIRPSRFGIFFLYLFYYSSALGLLALGVWVQQQINIRST